MFNTQIDTTAIPEQDKKRFYLCENCGKVVVKDAINRKCEHCGERKCTFVAIAFFARDLVDVSVSLTPLADPPTKRKSP